jgi:hypothetical protein
VHSRQAAAIGTALPDPRLRRGAMGRGKSLEFDGKRFGTHDWYHWLQANVLGRLMTVVEVPSPISNDQHIIS